MKLVVVVLAVLMSIVLFGCQSNMAEEEQANLAEVVVETDAEGDMAFEDATGAETNMDFTEVQEFGIDVYLDESEVYTEEQLTDALNVIADTFENDFPQCTLQEIVYDEEYSLALEEMNKEMFAIDNAVVFTSVFAVDDDYVSGPLNAGEVYEGYEWTLTMDADGNWSLVTNGYQ